MREKSFLLERVLEVFRKNGYSLFFYGKCFDLIAKKNDKWIVKVLYNLDTFTEKDAKNIKAISYFVFSYPFVVAEVSNNRKLEDEVLYFRFGVYAGTVSTLSKLIEGKKAEIFSVKGKHLVRIDCEKMKRLRIEKNLSLGALSKKVSLSKKSLYEIENNLVIPTRETVMKLEKILGDSIREKIEINLPKKEVIQPSTKTEKKIFYVFKKIGVEGSFLNVSFNFIGRKEKSLMVVSKEIETSEEKIVFDISKFLDSISFSVVERKDSLLPVVPLRDLNEISSFEELKERVLRGY